LLSEPIGSSSRMYSDTSSSTSLRNFSEALANTSRVYQEPLGNPSRVYSETTSNPSRVYSESSSNSSRVYLEPASTQSRVYSEPSSNPPRVYSESSSNQPRVYSEPTINQPRGYSEPTNNPSRVYTESSGNPSRVYPESSSNNMRAFPELSTGNSSRGYSETSSNSSRVYPETTRSHYISQRAQSDLYRSSDLFRSPLGDNRLSNSSGYGIDGLEENNYRPVQDSAYSRQQNHYYDQMDPYVLLSRAGGDLALDDTYDKRHKYYRQDKYPRPEEQNHTTTAKSEGGLLPPLLALTPSIPPSHSSQSPPNIKLDYICSPGDHISPQYIIPDSGLDYY